MHFGRNKKKLYIQIKTTLQDYSLIKILNCLKLPLTDREAQHVAKTD